MFCGGTRKESCVMEKKIVYNEDGAVRVLRGIIIEEDDYFIKIQRRDGIQRIGKKFIIRIEEGNDG